MSADARLVSAISDPDVDDATVRALARASAVAFVRGLDQIAEDSPRARGHRLTAFEALEAYGRQTLAEVFADGSALLSASPTAAARVLRDRRELLSLDRRDVALKARVSLRAVETVEAAQRVPIRECERIGRVLGLDERYLSVRSEPAML